MLMGGAVTTPMTGVPATRFEPLIAVYVLLLLSNWVLRLGVSWRLVCTAKPFDWLPV